MSSQTDLCNDALSSILGQAPITNIADGTANANRCKIALPNLIDAVLRMSRWRCAKYFATLVEDVSAKPPIKWDHAFKLPRGDDNGEGFCLRVWDVNDSTDIEWSVGAGHLLYVNDTSAKIEFVGRVTDPTLWDANLFQAMSTALASKLAVSILHDLKLSQQLYAMAKDIAQDAMSVNSQEGHQEVIESEELVNIRGDTGLA